MPWAVRQLTGTVGQLHEQSAGLLSPAGPAGRLACVMSPVDQAVVLGSTQADGTVDRDACNAAGVAVVQRRSGGGAVLVQASLLVWVDLFVPAGDPLWAPDVGRAAWWVGEAWAQALAASGLEGAEVWKGPMLRRPWSSLVCFGGLGPGEVVDPEGAKVVGVSQRRARPGALFQSACLLRWQPDDLVPLLALTPGRRSEALGALGPVARGIGPGRGAEVVGHLLASLP